MATPWTGDEPIAEVRLALMRAMRGLVPGLPLIDCARIANMVVDDALNGDLRSMNRMRAFLQNIVDASSRAEAARDTPAPAKEPHA